MTPSSLEPRLQEQLARLEARGRRHLGARLRRRSLNRALAWALPGAVVIPALWLLTQHWLPMTWPAVATASMVAVSVPMLVALVVYAMSQSRQRVAREEALAVFDRQLGLKDRLGACADLLAAPRRDAFAQAALIEAAPWVEQALTRPLTDPRPTWPVALRRRWPFVPAAFLLALMAGWMQLRAGAPSSAETLAAMTPAGDAAGLARSTTARETTPGALRAEAGQRAGHESDDNRGAPERGGAERPSRTPASTTPSGGTGATAAPQADSRSEPSAARPGLSGAAMIAAASPESRPQPSGASRSRGQEAERQPPQSPQPSQAAMPGAGQEDSDDPGASAAEPRSQGQQEAPSQRGSQPPAAPRQSKPSKDGDGQQSKSKNGNDSQNDGKGGGEGQNNGQRKGQEAGAKAGRGFASLLLARPMRDQVRGQTNPGPVASALQQGRPTGGPVTESVAQERDSLADSAAVMPAPPRTAQDRALLRDYFSREDSPRATTGAATGEATTDTAHAPRNDPKASR